MSTIPGAKGYDAHIVFLVGVQSFREDETGRASFYVAATRAKLVLHISGLKSNLLTEVQQVIRRARTLETHGS
jgi:superfamily I DNA and RNA helicase